MRSPSQYVTLLITHSVTDDEMKKYPVHIICKYGSTQVNILTNDKHYRNVEVGTSSTDVQHQRVGHSHIIQQNICMYIYTIVLHKLHPSHTWFAARTAFIRIVLQSTRSTLGFVTVYELCTHKSTHISL